MPTSEVGILEVDPELRLRPFAGDADVERAWPWYRDAETVALVDGPTGSPYDRATVAAMYDALGAQGEVYLIERRSDGAWEAIGDVTLAPETVPIVIAPGLRGRGIGRRVILRLVDRARVLGWTELRVRAVHDGNEPAHRLFGGLGFVARSEPPPAYVLRLAPVGGRPRS